MKLVAIDPGHTTGYVEAEATDGVLTLTKVLQIPWEERFSLMSLLCALPLPDAVIVESFRLYAHKARAQINNDFPSVRVIGIVEAAAYLVDILDRVHFQPASIRTRVQVLPEHQEVDRAGPHARDAYQHLRFFYAMIRRHGEAVPVPRRSNSTRSHETPLVGR